MREEDRDRILDEFAAWWYAEEQRKLREHAMKYIPNDSALGCYCSPKRCHGDIIAGYLNWKRIVKNEETQMGYLSKELQSEL